MLERKGSIRLQSGLHGIERILASISMAKGTKQGGTYGDKGREQTAGARRHLGTVPLGPSLGLLAPQHSPRDIVEVSRLCVCGVYLGRVLCALGHTGYR